MKSREMAGSWLPKSCSGEGGAAVDSEVMNEEENLKKTFGGGGQVGR